MRKFVIALVLAATAVSAYAADKKNLCNEGLATLTGTIGENRIFEAPEYWVEQSEPCRVHVIELEAANAACGKGAKFTVTGAVSHVKSDGEVSLVNIVKPEKMECGK